MTATECLYIYRQRYSLRMLHFFGGTGFVRRILKIVENNILLLRCLRNVDKSPFFRLFFRLCVDEEKAAVTDVVSYC